MYTHIAWNFLHPCTFSTLRSAYYIKSSHNTFCLSIRIKHYKPKYPKDLRLIAYLFTSKPSVSMPAT